MFSSIVRFELRYQLSGPIFWAAFALFFLLSFGSIASPYINVDLGGDIHKNAPTSILATCFAMSLFFTLVVTAFAANVMLRDKDSGFEPLVFTTRVSKSNYLFGRVMGAFLVSALCFAAVPIGIFFGTLAPWADPHILGSNSAASYVYAYALIALPTLFFLTAFFASVATFSRSVMGSYIGALGLFLIYLAGTFASSQGGLLSAIYSWTEPFDNAAIREATRYWTTAESNRLLPPFTGAVLGNRIVCIAFGICMLLLARFRLTTDAQEQPGGRQKISSADATPSSSWLLPRGAFGRQHAWSVLIHRTLFESRRILVSRTYIAMLILAIVLTIVSVANAGERYGTPIYPVTRVMISSASSGFSLFAIVIAIFYSGELVWHERERRIDGILDSSPIANWAYVVPKTLALAAVLLSTLVVSMMVDVLVQASKGYFHFEFAKYLLWYVFPQSINWILLAILAIFIQTVATNKYAGWGLMILYLVGTLILDQLGLDHVLYNFNSAPPVPLSDMNGDGQFWKAWMWLKIYWTAFSIALLALAHALWRRGSSTTLMSRLRAGFSSLKRSTGIVLASSLTIFGATGVFIFYNTNVINEYRTRHAEEMEDAAYEKVLGPLESAPQPSLRSVKLQVDLFPHEQKFESRGEYVLVNNRDQAIRDIFVRIPESLTMDDLHISGAQLHHDYSPLPVRAYRLREPMEIGGTRVMTFSFNRVPRGFSNSGITSPVVDNGTFLRNADMAPGIGVGDVVKIGDANLRRKYGLSENGRIKALEDATGRDRNSLDADWTTLDIVVSTDSDQTPVTSGKKISDIVEGHRRTAHFVSTLPVLNFFSIQSARYAERHQSYHGVDLAVFFEPDHSQNVDRMLQALATGMDYYENSFGAYPFDRVSVVEFPAYSSFAQAFPEYVAYSENVGFIADVRDKRSFDYVTFVTAHELSHQWWAHQLIGGDQQGATLLSETLAQYSALMVMDRAQGADATRRFLRYELDSYLKKRRGQSQPEMPLYRIEKQDYLQYSKGALVMYLLRDRLGEANVNRALKSLLAKYRFSGPPYPSSLNLIEELRAVAGNRDQELITDLLEKITLLDLRASEATATSLPDGRVEVHFTVEAHKYHADGSGEETEMQFQDLIDVGAFSKSPRDPSFRDGDAQTIGLFEIHSGVQRIDLLLDRAPAYVGVDPYNKWIDRRPDDNVTTVIP